MDHTTASPGPFLRSFFSPRMWLRTFPVRTLGRVLFGGRHARLFSSMNQKWHQRHGLPMIGHDVEERERFFPELTIGPSAC